jgi:hypothetical protein
MMCLTDQLHSGRGTLKAFPVEPWLECKAGLIVEWAEYEKAHGEVVVDTAVIAAHKKWRF